MTLAEPPVHSVDWLDGELSAGGRQWSYRDAGAGEVVLLLDPPDDSARGPGPLEQLAGHYRLIVPQLKPEGASTGFAEQHGPRDMGHLLLGFVEALGAERVAVISRGAAATVALWLAVEDPKSVTTLVLESPPLLDAVGDGPDADLEHAMTTLEVPTLVLIGQRAAGALPQHAGAYKRLPASTVGLVYEAGEDIRSERPSAFLSAVSEYLERGQAFTVSAKSTVIHA